MIEIGANGDELAEPATADADVDAVVGGDDTEEAPGEVDSGGGEDDAEAAPEAGGSGEAGAEVVTLDSFRKK